MKMKQQSKAVLLALVLELVSESTTNAFQVRSPSSAAAHTRIASKRSSVRPKRRVSSSPTELRMLEGFIEPISAVMQGPSVVPQVMEQLSQTFFFPPAMSTTHCIQTVGEACFGGMLGIAAIQGAMVMNQYRTNPDGGLIVPPGLTVGDEDATTTTNANNKQVFGVLENNFAKGSTPFGTTMQQTKKTPLTEAEIEAMVCDTEDNEFSCAMKKKWYHVASQIMAIALVPLAALAGPSWGLAAWMMRYGHILHLAVIFGLTHLYDFFRKLPSMDVSVCDPTNSKCKPQAETTAAEEPIFQGDHPRVIVLGDSMCVGIGTCEVFDDKKVYDIPLHKEEHLASSEEELESSSSSALPGPIFPRVLANTLSRRFQKPVAWRSAGVDGGSTLDIAEHLMDVVQDEVDKGQAPDLVVVLTGSNDLKHLLDGSASVKGFRSNLMSLAQQIRTISPKTRVVFPALPTYRMDQKSILNVFPLSVFLDSFMGVWDAQKRVVAEHPGVMNVELTVADVNDWYKLDQEAEATCGGGPDGVSLIAADGIHPNARCYEKWGEFVGNSLADQIMGDGQPLMMMKQQPAQETLPLTYGGLGGFQVPATFRVQQQQ